MNINQIVPLRGAVGVIRSTIGVTHETHNIHLSGQLTASLLIDSRILVLQRQIRAVTIKVSEPIGISRRPVISKISALSQIILRSCTIDAHKVVVILNNLKRLLNSQILSINDTLQRVSISNLLSLQPILSGLSLLISLQSSRVLRVSVLLLGVVRSLNLIVLSSNCLILISNLSVLRLHRISLSLLLSRRSRIRLILRLSSLILLSSSHSLLQRLNLRCRLLLSILSKLTALSIISRNHDLRISLRDLNTLSLRSLNSRIQGRIINRNLVTTLPVLLSRYSPLIIQRLSLRCSQRISCARKGRRHHQCQTNTCGSLLHQTTVVINILTHE